MNVSVKTNFTAGQVSPKLYGRGDLSVFENGARELKNVSIHTTGGVSRRSGTVFVDEVPTICRVVPFEFNTEQVYLLCFYSKGVNIYKNDNLLTSLETPWDEKQIFEMDWTQSADVLLLVHKDVPPKQIVRKINDEWVLEDWTYTVASNGFICCPYYNFYNYKETLTFEAYDHIAGGALTSSNKVFRQNLVGRAIKINNGLLRISSVSDDGRRANFKVICAPSVVIGGTRDWQEEAFSYDRGWPSTITFHQDRLVIGGSRSLPNKLWLSRTSDFFNFNTGSGLDDHAIEFGILSDQVNAIKAVVSNRQLLVFTTGTEWLVTGEPLTPSSIQLYRQTNIGSYPKKNVKPQLIDGATVFISRSGEQLREFLYTDTEDAYQATNLTLMSDDMLNSPSDMVFDPNSNILYIVLEDGSMSCLTSYRAENVNAWAKVDTQGKFLSVCILEKDIYFSIQREDKFFVEKVKADVFVDCAQYLSSVEPQNIWQGLDRFEGKKVSVVAEGFYAGDYVVSDGRIVLMEAASNVCIGYDYEHKIEPLPYVVDAARPFSPKAYRMVHGAFKLLDTNSFSIDVGQGYFSVPLRRMSTDKLLDKPPVNFSGDIQLRSLGWVRNVDKVVWSIKSSEPSSFTLLSVLSEIKAKD